ncbi:MAG: flagellar motor switch protein FliN [Balneolaceae bacterium]
MNKKKWTQTAKNFQGLVNLIFENLSDKEITTELSDSFVGDDKKTLENLKDFKILKSIEERFQFEILIGFKGDWQQLHNPAPEQDEPYEEENFFREISSQLTEFSHEVMTQIDVKLQFASFDFVNEEKNKSILNLNEYCLSKWTLTTPGDKNEKGQAEFLFGISTPPKYMQEQIAEEMEGKPGFESAEFKKLAEETVSELILEGKNQNDQEYENIKHGEGVNVEFQSFEESNNHKNSTEFRNINLLKDVNMKVTVELGRRKMSLGKVLQLVKGSVIELEKLAGEPVDIHVNGRCIALGDVVVIDEHFGVRITRLLSAHDTIKNGV